jgi:glutamyl/glutaminyl-tRNA synthetase
VAISEEKIQTLADFWPLVSFVFDGPVEDPDAFARVIGKQGAAEALAEARGALAETEPFDVAAIEGALRGVVERLDTKPGQVFQPIRVALAGQTVSPGIFETIALLGREETLARIDHALDRADAGAAQG